ncbi:hypothetical protein [Actinoplanes derwentensis]|uniref:mRNA interferase MazF n=1 Tax=Actinoplanes derwentensis TaxID=113562 RepID=A0A1H1WVQ5_9ACTN|nr:hypothetical protein [Actinoplanes derwentensis]GID86983.1 hypothetical protein Ade03nite_59070 [Actinoplanes derwentensis]SDT00259.1 mRNA interferase MazF [Actinoplanes derwentensis]
MERGELWWARIDEMRPVVLLTGGAGPEFCAVQVVEPATAVQRLGFVLLTGAQAIDAGERRRIVAAAGPEALPVGVEVFLGVAEGLAAPGVVRVALPRADMVFCTWQTTVGREHLVERIGVLGPAKIRELDVALELAGGGTGPV